jgi:hypothetical protein
MYAGVDFIPPVRDYEFGYWWPGQHTPCMLSEELSVLINIQYSSVCSAKIYSYVYRYCREYSTQNIQPVHSEGIYICVLYTLWTWYLTNNTCILFKTEHSCVCYALESIMYYYK